MPCAGARGVGSHRPSDGMAATETTVVLHGKPVTIREGDLLGSRSTNASSYLSAAVNHDYSHVTTAVRIGDEIRAVGVLGRAWHDASGTLHPAGVTAEPLSLYNDAIYARLWVVRPRTPRTAAQTTRLRLVANDELRRWRGNPKAYDSPQEFLYSVLGCWPATEQRWHCAELAAHLARACGDGAWPEGESTSVSIWKLANFVGEAECVF